MLTSIEIRDRFVAAFKTWDHTEVKSALLIPEGDPTLLFTNAGMVQFKSVFLGETPRPYRRAVSYQKCVRAGGKHNDLENVGQTARHHTFFEMLGNFSFGDYFKKEAITYAWELLTEGFHLDPKRLWVTVFREDDEAAALWRKIVPSERILRLGEKDNFWQMGETGPCGPCSEILMDQGPALHADCPGIGRCECDRYLEIWNLVFMQYDRNAAGVLSPLPKPSIDTGMGLERITAVCQGVTSNYDTDLFLPLLAEIGRRSGSAGRAGGAEGEQPSRMAQRVVADHLRAMTFLVGDGVIPSNEGRGYVLRRILRRAARFGMKLGFEGPFLHPLIETVVNGMRLPYPELVSRRGQIEAIVLGEEERFASTLKYGLRRMEELIEKMKQAGSQVIPGRDLFTLYDTYGFPIDLASEVAQEAGLSLDEAGFQSEMAGQRARARRSWVGGDLPARQQGLYRTLRERLGETSFTGYGSLTGEVTLLSMLKGETEVTVVAAGEAVDLILNPTPFYAESGGQVGDRGRLTLGDTVIEIEETLKPLPGFHLHRGRVTQGLATVGAVYQAQVDAHARKNTARNHTATHLLHAILREFLGDHVRQAGSLVAPDRLRFDFHHFTPLTEKQIRRIEARMNERVWEDAALSTEVMETQAAMASGAMALFGEKYQAEVRVVSVSDYSRELCGGTHCRATGEIGFFKLIREGSVAAGIRRIEAVTGPAAHQWVDAQEETIRTVSSLLKSRPEEVVVKLERLLSQFKNQDREMERFRAQSAAASLGPLSQVRQVGSVSVMAQRIDPAEMDGIRLCADSLRQKIQSGVVVVGALSPTGDKVSVVVMVTPDLTPRISADKIVKEIAGFVEGSGGGKSRMAQLGGKKVEGLDLALEESLRVIEKMTQERPC